MDDRIIESILNIIVEIDSKTSEEINKTSTKLEEREKELQLILRNRLKETEEMRLSKGNEIYDELVSKAKEEKSAILSQCFEHTNELDNLLEENKEKLRDQVFEKLGFL